MFEVLSDLRPQKINGVIRVPGGLRLTKQKGRECRVLDSDPTGSSGSVRSGRRARKRPWMTQGYGWRSLECGNQGDVESSPRVEGRFSTVEERPGSVGSQSRVVPRSHELTPQAMSAQATKTHLKTSLCQGCGRYFQRRDLA